MLHKLLGGDDKVILSFERERKREREGEGEGDPRLRDAAAEGCCKHCRRRFMMDGRANSGAEEFWRGLRACRSRRLIPGVECAHP